MAGLVILSDKEERTKQNMKHTQTELDALMPSILDKAFKGEDTVHP